MTRRGVTIVELICALSLGGIALLTGHLALTTASFARASLSSGIVTVEEVGVGHRRLADAVAMAEAVESGSPPFFGDSSDASFRSRCPVAGGWLEPCDVHLRVSVREGRGLVEFKTRDEPWVVLRRSDHQMQLRYLGTPGHTWRAVWGERTAQPSALALLDGPDTLVYRGAGW